MCGGVVKAPRWSGSLDAMLGSVVVFRSATGAVAEVAASEKGTEDA